MADLRGRCEAWRPLKAAETRRCSMYISADWEQSDRSSIRHDGPKNKRRHPSASMLRLNHLAPRDVPSPCRKRLERIASHRPICTERPYVPAPCAFRRAPRAYATSAFWFLHRAPRPAPNAARRAPCTYARAHFSSCTVRLALRRPPHDERLVRMQRAPCMYLHQAPCAQRPAPGALYCALAPEGRALKPCIKPLLRARTGSG